MLLRSFINCKQAKLPQSNLSGKKLLRDQSEVIFEKNAAIGIDLVATANHNDAMIVLTDEKTAHNDARNVRFDQALPNVH